MAKRIAPTLHRKILALRAEGLGSRRIARALNLTVGQAAGAIWRAENPEIT